MDRRHGADKKAALIMKSATLRCAILRWTKESCAHTFLSHPRGTSNQPDITLSLPSCCLLLTLGRNLNCIGRLGIVGTGSWVLVYVLKCNYDQQI